MSAVITKPNGVHETGSENAALFNRGNLPSRNRMLDQISERVGLRKRRIVEAVCPEKTILVRNLLVHAGREKIFVDDLLGCERENCSVAIAPDTRIRQRFERKIFLHERGDGDGARREVPG